MGSKVHASFTELLRTVYRFAISTQRKENFLINDVHPEIGFDIRFFQERSQHKSSRGDIKTFKFCHLPLGQMKKDDKELEALVKENFPVKCDLVDPSFNGC